MLGQQVTEESKRTSPSFIKDHQKGIIIGVVFCMILSFVLYGFNQQKVLVIYHQETDDVYCITNIEVGDKVTYEWIHSFEHIPWYEDFYVLSDNRLGLEEIRVAGFGAGIPENKGEMTVKDGMIVMTNIGEIYDHIQWFNSHTALQYIALNDQVIIRGDEMPHHEALALEIKGRVIQWLSHLIP